MKPCGLGQRFLSEALAHSLGLASTTDMSDGAAVRCDRHGDAFQTDFGLYSAQITSYSLKLTFQGSCSLQERNDALVVDVDGELEIQ